MDALKLESFDNNEIIFDLIKDLKKSFDKFPGLELSKIKLSKIYQEFLINGEEIISHKKIRDSVTDDLYEVFKGFKEKLNL